jgi:DNA-binding NarL/FixJ family response regulator
MQTVDAAQQTDHAHLIQGLSAMMLQINVLQALVRNDAGDSLSQSSTALDMNAMRNGLTVLEQITREMLYEVSITGNNLQLAELPGVSLSEALSSLVEETAENLGLSSRVAFSGEERPLSSYIERLMYRIGREALDQVQQHIGARKLRFVLTYGRDDLQMSIEDDGVPSEGSEPALSDTNGVPAPPFTPGSRETMVEAQFKASVLDALRGRIEHLGGSLEIHSGLEQGTQVQVRVPYVHHVHPEVQVPISSASSTSVGVSQDTRVRVLVVDGQAVTRAGLHRLLEGYPDLEIVGEASDGVQAVSEAVELGPQVVLMDTQLSNNQALEALRQIKQLNTETRVLLLSSLDREEYLYESLRAGADGYVLKDIAPDELAQAIRTVAHGEILIQPQIAGRLISRFGQQTRGNSAHETLTAREQEVLRLLARGLRNKEIAARLYVSERTVNFHLANIYQKLNVSGRTEALSKAHEQGLLYTTPDVRST